MDNSIYTIILAAGEGERLGYPKALLEIKGQWMLPTLIKNFEENKLSKKVLIVIREEHQERFLDHGINKEQLVINKNPELGKNHSILKALDEIPKLQSIAIHPCDTPLIYPQSINTLFSTWAKSPTPSKRIARLVNIHGRGGHPLIVGHEFIEPLKKLLKKKTLRDFMHQEAMYKIDVPVSGDPGPFLNINTKEQLEWLESLTNISELN